MNPKHPTDDRLIAYALDELKGSTRDELEIHLESCDRCRAESEAIALVIDSERAASPGSAPLRILVDALSRRAVSPAWYGRPALRTALGIAACVLMVVIFGSGFALGRQTASATSQETMSAQHTADAHIQTPLPTPPPVRFSVARSAAREAAFVAGLPREADKSPSSSDTQSDSL
jgi:anti-sigma factor RsiW